MNNIFNDIKAIYTKSKIEIEEREMYQNIGLCKWLAIDEDNLSTLAKLMKYIYYITPLHFFYLLYCSIGKKQYPPYLHKIDKEEKKENKKLSKIRIKVEHAIRIVKVFRRIGEKTSFRFHKKLEMAVNTAINLANFKQLIRHPAGA